ncbi:GntR family transcriptional regulator [Acuticoccus sp. M5D2P5]|uniref:GntR family transcriptional regulator n=1 Tax=Acuticoccus kalidii TaxID=2910977 RepID=UPI001F29879C|nr:GntR family transcriptional regulator [Acuticoccus kalidii]MCF3934746.1 GntR family transcriptional regulator [Acuticoccus kalidii]
MNVLDTALSRPPLSVELADRIRAMIIAGELADDEKVPEKALTERFGVSRTPLREALKILSAEGFVRLVPNRGARVCRVTVDEVEEAFPVLAALEALAGELAVQRIAEDEIADVAAKNAAMRTAFEAANMPLYFELNQAIHGAILAAAGNPTLTQYHQMLSQRVRRARYLANMTPDRWRQAMDEHDEILAALAARDGTRLAAVLEQHLKNKMETVKRALSE